MILKILKGIRNHPKKSIVFASILTYGGNYAKEKYEENVLMRSFCLEALEYGKQPYRAGDERHVTVILNPAANSGKGKGKYEKYCAPLLHLAGMKVALVRTEHEDEAKQLMEVMDNTSAVIVAGGDGTLSEILTGLLRREDRDTAAKRFPLGILPLGETNTAASSIFGFNKTPDALHLAEATMAIIRNVQRTLDVIEVTPIEYSDTGEITYSKPVYAASLLEWGAFRDAHDRKGDYWYWAFLKKYMVYVFSSYKDLAWNCAADIEYSLPCSGCSQCIGKQIEAEATKERLRPKRWWEAFMPRSKVQNTEQQIDYTKIINDKCGERHSLHIENVSDVRVASCNTIETEDIPGHTVVLKLGKENLSSFGFIKEGMSREWFGIKSHEKEFIIGELSLIPNEVSFKNKKDEDRKFSIDNDDFEVRAMKIKPRPRAVTIFAKSKDQIRSL